MKTLTATAIALSILAAPALAYGPTTDIPVLTYPTDTATVSTQNCAASDAKLTKCN